MAINIIKECLLMSKISIIGAGSIGATTAFALLQKGVATEIIINDILKKEFTQNLKNPDSKFIYTYKGSISVIVKTITIFRTTSRKNIITGK